MTRQSDRGASWRDATRGDRKSVRKDHTGTMNARQGLSAKLRPVLAALWRSRNTGNLGLAQQLVRWVGVEVDRAMLRSVEAKELCP